MKAYCLAYIYSMHGHVLYWSIYFNKVDCRNVTAILSSTVVFSVTSTALTHISELLCIRGTPCGPSKQLVGSASVFIAQ